MFVFHDPRRHEKINIKFIIFKPIDENDTETFTTFGTQPTTEISQTTTLTSTFKDDQTYYQAPQGAK